MPQGTVLDRHETETHHLIHIIHNTLKKQNTDITSFAEVIKTITHNKSFIICTLKRKRCNKNIMFSMHNVNSLLKN